VAGFDQASDLLGRSPVTSKLTRFRHPLFSPNTGRRATNQIQQHNRAKHVRCPDAEFALNRPAHFPIGMPTIIIK
jgi:hypothetical protein